MKNNLKNIWLTATVIIIALVLPIGTGRSELSILGTVETLGHLVTGETTVTPSYCLYTWDYSGFVKNDVFGDHTERLKFRYDPVGNHTFYTSVYKVGSSTPVTDNAPFVLFSVALNVFNCPESGTAAQAYTIMMTCSVVTSGLAPPTGPFAVSFKTLGTQLSTSCTDNPTATREFRKTYKIMPFGFATGRVGTPDYSFAFPFQCWAGETYLF